MAFNLEDLITMDEAADILRVDKTTLLRAIKANELQASEIGRGYRTTRQWLQEYVDRKTIKVGGNTENAKLQHLD